MSSTQAPQGKSSCWVFQRQFQSFNSLPRYLLTRHNLLPRLRVLHICSEAIIKFLHFSSDTKKANGGLDTVTLVIILASVIGGGAFCLVVIFMLCYRRRSSRQRSANMAGNGDALWANKGPGYALPKDQLHMDYTGEPTDAARF